MMIRGKENSFRPLSTICLINIFFLCSLHYKFVLGTSSSSSSSSANQWPLRYHNSPWLHKEFIVRSEPNRSPPVTNFDDETWSVNCDEFSGPESGFSGYGRSSSSCESNNECDTFNPSAYCKRRVQQQRSRAKEEGSFSVDDLLARFAQYRLEKAGRSPSFVQRRDEFQQCHYLTDSLINEMCRTDRRPIRREIIQNINLRSCRRFSVEKSLSQHLYSLVVNSTDCGRILRELLLLDDLVEELACEYESILHRYDCEAKWSVKWTCRDCRLAYRDWLCSVIIPYHENGIPIKPCQSICEQVEQKCPHLHPYGKGQYAGEPVFLCIDPNIPFNQKITPKIPFGNKNRCYNSCDLESCLNEDYESPLLDCYEEPERIELSLSHTEQNDSLLTGDTTTNSYTIQPDFSEEDVFSTQMNELIEEDTQTTSQTEQPTPSEVDLSDTYYDETSPPSTTATNWAFDEDYYVIQSAPEPNKHSQSIQYIELESNFNLAKNEDPHFSNLDESFDQIEEKEATETSSSPIEQSNLQDIYREAIASTTVDSFDLSNEQTDNRMNEEIVKEDFQDDWTTTNTPVTSTSSDDFPEMTLPTGTESSDLGKPSTISPIYYRPRVGKGSQKLAYHSHSSSAETENNSGYRFRHYNSRNKEFIQQKNSGEHKASEFRPQKQTLHDNQVKGKKELNQDQVKRQFSSQPKQTDKLPDQKVSKQNGPRYYARQLRSSTMGTVTESVSYQVTLSAGLLVGLLNVYSWFG